MPTPPAAPIVWITRDESPGGPLSRAIIAEGLAALLEPVIERCIVADLSREIAALRDCDWLVLTSPFAISALAPLRPRCRIAVVGESSRALAQSFGLRPALIGEDGTGESLWLSLRQHIKPGERILYPRSAQAELPDLPPAALHAPVLYETRRRGFDPEVALRCDIAAIASPSAARAIAWLKHMPPMASIGPTTTRALRTLGISPRLESPEQTFPAFAKAIAAAVIEQQASLAPAPSA
jgi:uroporphyrinogen-III synthase